MTERSEPPGRFRLAFIRRFAGAPGPGVPFPSGDPAEPAAQTLVIISHPGPAVNIAWGLGAKTTAGSGDQGRRLNCGRTADTE